MAVAIVDLQSRFNLNNLVNEQGAPDPAMTAALARLLARLGAPARLAAQWQDWIDADQQVGPDGAEDADYGGERRTAGMPEADVSALRLLRDIDAEAYDRIAPYVATLPPGTPLNVNTASAEALQSLSSIIDAGLAARIVARQARGGFKDVQEFILFVGGDAELAARVAVGSRHFEAIVTVRHGDHWLRLRSQLERDPASGDIAVTARHRMPLDAAVPGEQNATRRVAARS